MNKMTPAIAASLHSPLNASGSNANGAKTATQQTRRSAHAAPPELPSKDDVAAFAAEVLQIQRRGIIPEPKNLIISGLPSVGGIVNAHVAAELYRFQETGQVLSAPSGDLNSDKEIYLRMFDAHCSLIGPNPE
jgi:hypothetical protein